MVDNLPEADVVILSWNRSDSTIETIINIIEQYNIKLNIWLIDQGSDTSQIQLLREFIHVKKDIHLIELERNIGVPAGRNLGMKLGRAEFIFCIDNDAIFESRNALVIAINKFREDKNLAIIGFKINNYFTETLEISSWAYARKLIEKQDNEFLTSRFCGAGHAIRRSALEKTDYYDESIFFYWEELDLSYQMINLGYKICFFPNIVILHKVSSEKRITWQGERFYFLVRNAIYLNWKYFRSIYSLLFITTGYLIKGFYNGLFKNTIRGIIQAFILICRSKQPKKYILNKNARDYIYRNDIVYRGNICTRIKEDVLRKLSV